MSELSSKFSRKDIETLIEAIGDWEQLGNHDFHVLNMIKNIPIPPEEDEDAHEAITQIKDHFRRREKDILRSRDVRQEQAVFLKAKLMLIRKDLGIDQLFEMAADASIESQPEAAEQKVVPKKVKKSEFEKLRRQLELAEFFIVDLGVKNHYDKFVAEKLAEDSAAAAEKAEKPVDGGEEKTASE